MNGWGWGGDDACSKSNRVFQKKTISFLFFSPLVATFLPLFLYSFTPSLFICFPSFDKNFPLLFLNVSLHFTIFPLFLHNFFSPTCTLSLSSPYRISPLPLTQFLPLFLHNSASTLIYFSPFHMFLLSKFSSLNRTISPLLFSTNSSPFPLKYLPQLLK